MWYDLAVATSKLEARSGTKENDDIRRLPAYWSPEGESSYRTASQRMVERHDFGCSKLATEEKWSGRGLGDFSNRLFFPSKVLAAPLPVMMTWRCADLHQSCNSVIAAGLGPGGKLKSAVRFP
jgi:hypothetical protein